MNTNTPSAKDIYTPQQLTDLGWKYTCQAEAVRELIDGSGPMHSERLTRKALDLEATARRWFEAAEAARAGMRISKTEGS